MATTTATTPTLRTLVAAVRDAEEKLVAARMTVAFGGGMELVYTKERQLHVAKCDLRHAIEAGRA